MDYQVFSPLFRIQPPRRWLSASPLLRAAPARPWQYRALSFCSEIVPMLSEPRMLPPQLVAPSGIEPASEDYEPSALSS